MDKFIELTDAVTHICNYLSFVDILNLYLSCNKPVPNEINIILSKNIINVFSKKRMILCDDCFDKNLFNFMPTIEFSKFIDHNRIKRCYDCLKNICNTHKILCKICNVLMCIECSHKVNTRGKFRGIYVKYYCINCINDIKCDRCEVYINDNIHKYSCKKVKCMLCYNCYSANNCLCD